ncbi:MAG TPA: hypothetical protein PKL04_00720 [Methanofastidiosum sp.]|nr:hypothetical protein [Methanofastidiosum sp.]
MTSSFALIISLVLLWLVVFNIIWMQREILKHLKMIDDFDKEVAAFCDRAENEILKLKERK